MGGSTEQGAAPATRLPPWTPTQERLASVVVRLMTAANVWIYRLSGGRLGGTFLRGAPVCLVTTRGKRSGQLRTVALLYLADGDDIELVASKGGMSHHPAWYHNMLAHPEVEVQIGAITRPMRARRASDVEKAALWPKLVAMYRDYDDYQARTTRNIPVMILS
ncbi:MAG TPA: nitroreductase family deazaflavin-dependent oxidoreductase [Candidatus Binatia bacterium]|nr:nitroreductase family deazaflavin-dependent oxidoreductase [Candidatus Binatia bacterium]